MTRDDLSAPGGVARRRGIALAGAACLLLWAVGAAAVLAPRIDRELAARTRAALAQVGAPADGVNVRGRQVVVEGRVASAEMLQRATRAVSTLPGVRRVEMRLEVSPTVAPGGGPARGAPGRTAEPPGSRSRTSELSAGDTEPGVGEARDGGPESPEPRDLEQELARVIGGRGIDFARYGEELTRDAREVLADVARFLMEHPEVAVEIGGHTDSRGALERNLEISQRRAEAVRRELIARGIAADRLRAVGYGPASPIADNDTEEGRRANRRVEFGIEERE